MEQFDVYKLKHGDIVVVLQHNSFKAFRTRVVAPLIPRARAKLATSLNPVLKHSGRDWVLATHLVSVVDQSSMTDRLGSIAGQDYAIKRAIDQLFLGV